LGNPTDPVYLDLHSRVSVDARGRFYVIPAQPGKIAVYDQTGRFARTFGQLGDGPGEFRSVSTIAVGPGDTVHVFSNARATVFASDGSFIRTRIVPGSFRVRSAVVLANGAWLLQGLVNSHAGIGLPFHTLPKFADTLHSFGAVPGEQFIWRSVYDEMRRLAVVGDTVLWSARLPHYLLEQWNINGTPLKVIERKADWFTPWTWTPGRETDVRIAPPDPHVSGLAVDSAGLLWVAVQIRDTAWKPGQRSEAAVSTAEYARSIDTMIEVIDPRRPALLASRRVPGAVWLAGSGLAAEYVEDAVGFTQVRLYQLRLLPN
jgi:hypothetical protein